MNYAKTVIDDRREWALSVPRVCMACNGPDEWPGLQVHEICRRSQAPRKWGHACNYVKLCERCHAGVFANAPHAMQLAIKLIGDRDHYDLSAWNAISGKGIRGQEVENWVRILNRATINA